MTYAFSKITFWRKNQEDFCMWDRRERKKSHIDSTNNFGGGGVVGM